MVTNGDKNRPYPKLVWHETISVAIETYRTHKLRFMLTGLGMVIGTASLILVVTIGLTGKQYVLQQIQNIGANMMVASYEGGSIYGSESSRDYLTLDDMNAVRAQVPGITNSSPMISLHDRIAVPGGKEREGAYPRSVIAVSVGAQPGGPGGAFLRRRRCAGPQQGRRSSPSISRIRYTVPRIRRSGSRSKSMGCPSW